MAYRPRWLRPTVNTRLAALDITPFEAFLEAVRQLAMTSADRGNAQRVDSGSPVRRAANTDSRRGSP